MPLVSFGGRGSIEGKGVGNAKELFDGEAKTIGPGETGVVGEGGVRGEASGESEAFVTDESGSESAGSGKDRERCGRGSGGRRDACEAVVLDPFLVESSGVGKLGKVI